MKENKTVYVLTKEERCYDGDEQFSLINVFWRAEDARSKMLEHISGDDIFTDARNDGIEPEIQDWYAISDPDYGDEFSLYNTHKVETNGKWDEDKTLYCIVSEYAYDSEYQIIDAVKTLDEAKEKWLDVINNESLFESLEGEEREDAINETRLIADSDPWGQRDWEDRVTIYVTTEKLEV